MIRPRTAMLLAAGLGTRMRPLTDATAKSLLRLGGRTLLDHALDRLGAAGVETVVVNTHWQADAVAAHLAARAAPPRTVLRREEALLDTGGGVLAALDRLGAAGVERVVVNTHWHADAVAAHLAARAEMPRTVLRREEALLDTGGGVLAALDMLGPDPFFVVNGDSFWLDGPTPALDRLSAAWDAADADALLLVHRTFETRAETGPGDFFLDPLGTVRRRREGEILPYIYAGIQLVAPRLLAEAPQGRFSMTLAWDRAIAAGRLRAIVHDGLWFHLSTPLDLAEAEATLSAQRTGDSR